MSWQVLFDGGDPSKLKLTFFVLWSPSASAMCSLPFQAASLQKAPSMSKFCMLLNILQLLGKRCVAPGIGKAGTFDQGRSSVWINVGTAALGLWLCFTDAFEWQHMTAMADQYGVASRFDWPVILLRSAWQMVGESGVRSSFLCQGSTGVDTDFSGGAGAFEASTQLLEMAALTFGIEPQLKPRSVCEAWKQTEGCHARLGLLKVAVSVAVAWALAGDRSCDACWVTRTFATRLSCFRQCHGHVRAWGSGDGAVPGIRELP